MNILQYFKSFFVKTKEVDSEKALLPKFTYMLDAMHVKAIVKSKKKCDVCGKSTGYIYQNAFYSEEDVEAICPWCIASGAAAKKYNGVFHDFELEDDAIEESIVKEWMERTPGYDCMQPGTWPCHCQDVCTFVDYVGWDDIVNRHLEEVLQDDLARIREEYQCENQDIGHFLKCDSALSGYLFQCTHCGKYRLIVDLD